MKMFRSRWKRPATGEARREPKRRHSFYQRLLAWMSGFKPLEQYESVGRELARRIERPLWGAGSFCSSTG